MSRDAYLKSDIVIEPLVDLWYAWPHLISPVTAARNIAKRHVPIMQSYINATAVHVAANKNPAMRGGPFIDYPEPRVQEIKNLLSNTLSESNHLISLAEDIDKLNALIKTFPKGASARELYRDVPSSLRGFIELVYDTHNNLSYRFIEPLLYRSPFYYKSAQSLAIWEAKNHSRPFVLSTPRLPWLDPDTLHLKRSFDDDTIDYMGEMKFRKKDVGTLYEMLGLNDKERMIFDTFLSETRESTYSKCTDDTVRIRYFGHACVLIETANTAIMIDPVIAYKRYDENESIFSYADLPDVIDFVLLTHNHQDHVLLEMLLPLRHKIKHVVAPRSLGGAIQDPSLKLTLNAAGFKSVIEIEEMQTLTMGDFVVTGTPFFGEHSDLNILSKMCFHVVAGSTKVLFVADSAVLENAVFKYVHDALGSIDILFMGMECDGAPLSWLYGPLMDEKLPREIDNTRRLNGSDSTQGMELVNIFSPKEVYVYAMGQEPFVEFISSIKYTDQSAPIVESNKLIAECRGRGLTAERLYGMKEIVKTM